MVRTRSVRGGNSSQPLGRGQVPNNLPPHPLPPIPHTFPHVDHAEGGDENQPHNSAHNSASTANQDVVATQLAAMQQQFGVFQLVLAQLLARNNPGDPLINLLNPAPQPSALQQNPEPVQHAPAISESQGQSHIAPVQQPFHDDVTRRLDSLEKLVAEQIPLLETYDGTKDPDDHRHAFYSCMQAQNASDALMCKIFPSTLRVLEVNSFDQAVGITTVISGLSHERFRDSLLKHPTTTFNENPTPIKNQHLDWRDENPNRKRMKTTQNRGPMPTSTLRFGRPNSAPPQQPTSPMRTTAVSRDHARYCDFHQDHDHTTEQCNSLRSELESLAQKGLLNEYIQRAEQPRFVRKQGPQPQGVRNPPNRQGVGYQQTSRPLPPPARIIHMITGGLEAGGLSSKQRKLYVREVKHQNRVQKRKLDDAKWKNQPITFTSADLDTIRVLVDTGRAPDIMYFHCFESLGLDPALLQRYDGSIYGFNNQPVPVEGVLTMNVAFGSGQSYSHLCMKFPTLMGIATLRGNEEVARHCYITSVTQPQKGKDQTTKANPKRILDNRCGRSTDDRDPTRKTQIGTRLSPNERTKLIAFLRENNDVFAWISADMSRIPTLVYQHKLSTNPLKKPVAQKRRLFRGERLTVIKEEVEKLLQVGFVRWVDYCEWVANLVLVKKANGKWRMCIDYTNLNDACPKDCYPMPNIDKLVEPASGNERLSLLDAYSGYHQVPMTHEDVDKISFYAGDEIYCYVMMPFGLKNVGTTYQKMVTIVFRAQIGQNLEVYVDDIVMKSLKAGDHLIDIEETFNNLKKNRMRLNLAKCIFGVESGKFLSFMVSRRGIEDNPEKIKAVVEMEPPKSVKDMQRLTGRVAALHRFISKSADKCLPFFKIVRLAAQKDESGKQKKFAWNSECQAAFDELKSYLCSPPLLTKADDGEILYLYLGISDEAISSVLVREEGKQQKPVYYISSMLHRAEIRYSIAEKAALAVVISVRKLRSYFQ
ncbi:hypothetical protein SLEP1_g22684 [Rubroshorea leprosula]|uniref:Reverse transcriptase/retrotransposon-derived protein RNase H-like domain-containing protein n=1 Tax=Rubroshorea leprosula TaxID=152421 RepID=A0AAV5J9X8_9ROSI|nr:hypothetical protein SLEP1_g22684 [Rubroshorea leprosula]